MVKHVKKLLIGLVVIIAAAFGLFKFIENTEMGGDTYYVQITTDGKQVTLKDDSGQEYLDYEYQLTGYDDKGNSKELSFRANKERPLRKNAYLKVTYNSKKEEVTQWEEVNEKTVPQKALTQLK